MPLQNAACWLLLTSAGALTFVSFAFAGNPSPVAEYRDSVAPLQHSRIVSVQVSRSVDALGVPELRRITSLCIRIGDLAHCEYSRWADRLPGQESGNLPLHDRTTYWITGRQTYALQSLADGKVALYVTRGIQEHQIAAWQGAFLCGYFPGNADRIDRVLVSAGAVVRAKREEVDGVNCVVVDAVTGDARHTVWFAPDRGGCILKMVRVQEGEALRQREQRERGLRPPGVKLPEIDLGVRVTQTLDNVRVEKIDGLWIPVGGRYTEEVTYAEGPPSVLIRTIERTDIKLNPDVSNISFEPQVPDGTTVRFVGERDGIPWEWRGGQIVPREDKAVTARLDELVAGRRFEPPKEGFPFHLLAGPAMFVGLVFSGAGIFWLWSSWRLRRES